MKFFRFIFFFSLVLYFFSSQLAFAEKIKINDVKVIGNSRISTNTILNIAGINKKKFDIELNFLNDVQKKIFLSNFFSNVEIKVVNENLEIIVYENPLVDYFIITGLENNSEFQKYIEEKISLKTDVIFSESLLNKDISFIKQYFSSQGYFNNKISYEVKKISSDKVNVFLNIQLNNKFLIKNIFFIGDKKFSSSRLSSIISSSQDSFFSFFSSSSLPSTERLNYDISLLKNFYLTEGYYDVQISNASIDLLDDKYVNLTFAINGGNQYKLTSYTINNSSNFLTDIDISFINQTVKKYINTIYNNKSISNLKTNISNYLENKNILVNLNYLLTKTSESTLLISFNIEQILDKKVISNIIVLGNDITDEKVIRNNLFFAEGDIFINNKIDKSLDLLKSLGIFKDVKIDVINANNQNVNVKILIEEKPTGEISGGLAVGTAGSSITFNLKENNFFGQGIAANVGVDIGTQQVLFNLGFVNPDFNSSGNTLSNNAFVSKSYYDNAGYENKVIGNNISYKYEIYQDIALENGISITYDSISADSSASSLIKSREGDYFTSRYFYNVISDKRNRKFQPTSGYTFSFGQGFSIPPSDIPAIYNSVSGSFYKQISENFVGSIKYKIKSINSLDEQPVKLSDRVFVSESDLHGFAFRGAGPKISGDYVGGNYLYSTNFSTTIPNGLPESWKASTNVFFDIANVWGSDFSGVSDSNQIRSSVGIGATWMSPIGPISFSYAEPISKSSTDSIEKFNFKLGGVF